MAVNLYDISFSRGITSLSFTLNVACQIYYGLFANPSIKQVADAHHSAFSPNPYFITAFFILQAIAQLFFIRGLFAVTATPDEPTLSERFFRFLRLTPASSNSNHVNQVQTFYSLPFALGNLLHIAWTVFWMQEWFWVALPMVIINTLIQFHAGVILLDSCDPTVASEHELSAHVISKFAAGVGCLGVLDTATTAAGYVGPPSAAVQIIALFLLVKLAAIYEGNGFWNIAILFDTLALCAGQPSWSPSLALAAAFIVWEIYVIFFSPCAGEPW